MKKCNKYISKIKILILCCIISCNCVINANTDKNVADKICREIISGRIAETNGYFERDCWDKINSFIYSEIMSSGSVYDYKIDIVGNKAYCNYKIKNSLTKELEAWLIVIRFNADSVDLVKIYVY